MSLAADTRMGRLELRVRDMGTLFDYYTKGIGLTPISEDKGAATLGLHGTPVVRLTEAKDLRPAPRGSAGLFHTAVLYQEQAGLAGAIERMARHFPHTYTGAGDHLVSQAFYFTDPEGNGVELYHDRPREQWNWVNGQVQMDTLYVDPNEYMVTHLSDASHQEAKGELGHVHLQVGDIPTARKFYVDDLGFDQTFLMGGQALFVSAGGYHHHMAMNVWNSRGANPRSSTLGMGVVDILVPTKEELDTTAARLRGAGHQPTFDGQTLSVMDPWNNEIRLSVG
ncbi:VOC family protein [Tessaracoccus oleiagri]|uniref:Catechol 2,3-dioxygenase n=1 Tax=Tessaracoccus oleiagri TaxID=686624 RepID=A0A1G9H8B0_9ACTN|nr:VOC family protein [Tessaracoccus oleiagri]SDL09221.1 catechol 2,3-dioxygenase [Tessaracoccus oleiagri]